MARSPQELTRLLEKCATFLARHDAESASPVGPTRIAEVRMTIVYALSELGRAEESILAATTLVAFCAAHEPAELDPKYLVYTLSFKAAALGKLGRLDEAAATYAEIIVRFHESGDPAVRSTAAGALSVRSRLLMRDRDTFAQGIAVSDELIELLLSEPDDTALEIAEIAVGHIRLLLSSTTGRTESIVVFVSQTIRANLGTAWRNVAGRLRAADRLPTGVPGAAAGLGALGGRLTPAAVTELAARLEQARKVNQAVEARLASVDDPDAGPLRARAEMLGASCLWCLGDAVGAVRAMQAMNERRDPDVVAAYQATLEDSIDVSRPSGQIHAAALLNQRADALVGEDPALARIAFEDSLAKVLPASTPRLMRWLLSQLRPRA